MSGAHKGGKPETGLGLTSLTTLGFRSVHVRYTRALHRQGCVHLVASSDLLHFRDACQQRGVSSTSDVIRIPAPGVHFDTLVLHARDRDHEVAAVLACNEAASNMSDCFSELWGMLGHIRGWPFNGAECIPPVQPQGRVSVDPCSHEMLLR